MEVQGRVKRRVKMAGYNEGRYQREWTVGEGSVRLSYMDVYHQTLTSHKSENKMNKNT